MAAKRTQDGERFVGASEMAHILGVSRRHLRRLVESGELPPPARDGARPEFEVGTTVRGYLATIAGRRDQDGGVATQRSADVALTGARTRKAEADAALLARSLREMETRLVSRADAAAVWAELTKAVRKRVLALPKRLARRLAEASSAAEAESIIRDAVSAALLEISTAPIEFEVEA